MMSLFEIPLSATVWLAPMTGLAVVATAAALILLRDHLRLERHASGLEAEVSRLRSEMRHLVEASQRIHEAIWSDSTQGLQAERGPRPPGSARRAPSERRGCRIGKGPSEPYGGDRFAKLAMQAPERVAQAF